MEVAELPSVESVDALEGGFGGLSNLIGALEVLPVSIVATALVSVIAIELVADCGEALSGILELEDFLSHLGLVPPDDHDLVGEVLSERRVVKRGHLLVLVEDVANLAVSVQFIKFD